MSQSGDCTSDEECHEPARKRNRCKVDLIEGELHDSADLHDLHNFAGKKRNRRRLSPTQAIDDTEEEEKSPSKAQAVSEPQDKHKEEKDPGKFPRSLRKRDAKRPAQVPKTEPSKPTKEDKLFKFPRVHHLRICGWCGKETPVNHWRYHW